MATFTVDLLTGNVYLFNGDFTGSGSTPTSGGTYPQVNVYGDLPSASSVATGQIYVVINGSGDYIVDRKESGLYFSNGTTWSRLGDIPSFFSSDNFQVYDADDNTKGLEFVVSGVSTNVFRQLTVQDSDGVIAYLSDFDGYWNSGQTVSWITNSDLSLSGHTSINGGISFSRTVVTGTTYTPLKSDAIIGIRSTTANTVTINLPEKSVVGKVYWIFKDEGFLSQINPITFSAATGNLIENQEHVDLKSNGGSITIYNDEIENWYII